MIKATVHVYKFKCDNCQKNCERIYKYYNIVPKKPKRFCSRHCSNQWLHKNGKMYDINSKTTYEYWIKKYGKEIANLKKQQASISLSKANAGDKNSMSLVSIASRNNCSINEAIGLHGGRNFWINYNKNIKGK